MDRGHGKRGWRNPQFGKPLSEDTKRKISIANSGQKREATLPKAWKKILEEAGRLEKLGFKCIPITNVIPDIIAIKKGKIYAVEVESGKPNYMKYHRKDYRKYFEDVIWILR